jgi:hypothetical protein
MSDTVVGRWILENKEKYFPASLLLPENKANDLHEVIHRGWNEDDNIVVQEELKKELIKAYPNAFKPALPNGEYPTNEDAGFQEAMRRAGPVMSRKYGEFWPQGAVFKDFKWRIIDQLMEAEKFMKIQRQREPEKGNLPYTVDFNDKMFPSIVETFFLTSPLFKEARQKEKIDQEQPYNYPGEVAFSSAAPQSEVANIEATLTELLKEKYDPKMVDNKIAEAWQVHPGPGNLYGQIPWFHKNQPAWVQPLPKVHQIGHVYIAYTFAERKLANPKKPGENEFNGFRYSVGEVPVTLLDKRMSGKYTPADTENLERIRKSEDLVAKHGLEGLFGGLHRRRKTKKSKRGGKKRKTTRKH